MTSLEEIFDQFKNLKILIIGDIMIDSYIWGKVSRISPEAPVPIVQVVKEESRLGGAGNVALNIKAMGAQAILCGIAGKDNNQNKLSKLLEKENIRKDGIFFSSQRKTTIKHRVLAGSQHVLRIDNEDATSLNNEEENHILELIAPLIPTCDAIIFEDYNKGLLTEKIIKKVIEWSNNHQKPTLVDPKKNNFLDYKGVNLFKPNLKELIEGIHQYINPTKKEEIDAAAKIIQQQLQCENVVITLSEFGIYASDKKHSYLIPAHVRSIADVSGAGDTVISILALCLALQIPIQLAAALANLAGGLVCEEIGVVPINWGKLLKEAQKQQIN